VITKLHSFSNIDGKGPVAGLTLGTDGNFYGVTEGGGSSNNGTVFKITPAGALTTLYSFSGSDGESPAESLTLGPDGNFYGTTEYGGSFSDGTVFQITPSGQLTSLYSFSGPDGSVPSSNLAIGPDGNFYGVTCDGGADGYGTIFQITTTGTITQVFSFDGSNGQCPAGGLALGNDGNFYGSAVASSPEYGTIFKITPTGSLTTLYSSLFGGTEASLILGPDGNFYGVAGVEDYIFEITPQGTFSVAFQFNGLQGEDPLSPLMLGPGSVFYGETAEGGTTFLNGKNGDGAIFSMTLCETGPTVCSTTTITPSLNPVTYGNPVTFNATITPAQGSGVPTGSVTFYDGATVVANEPLVGGVASVTTSQLVYNVGAITVVYSGDTNFKSSSAYMSEAVEQVETTSKLSAAPSPSIYNQPVTLTAAVTPVSGTGICPGSVTFKSGSLTLGTSSLTNNSAVLTTSALAAGKQTLTASYSEDGGCEASSATTTLEVQKSPTNVALTSSSNPANVGASVSFVATISAEYGGLPSGQMTFYQNGVQIGSPVPLTGASAVLTTSFSTAGTYSIAASYSGDSNFQAGKSATPLRERITN
jgi:uncharacterized repeat protein (TIGR03803 family)